MAFINFDADRVGELVMEVIDTFDFTLPGRDQSLGRDLCIQAASDMEVRGNDGKDVAGNAFKPNEEEYAAYKDEKYGVDRPGELGGQMLSLLSLLGNPVIEKDKILMTYGLGVPPSKNTSRTGVLMLDQELTATDVEKAEYMVERGNLFYGFDPAMEEALVRIVEERLEQHITDLGF